MKNFKKTALLIVLIVIGNVSFSQDNNPSYKDMVSENPQAEATIQVVSDYVNALISNNMSKASSLLSETYIGYGPAENDSINKMDTTTSWKEAHLARTNEKVSFISQTFRVLQGDLKGDWVSQWGTYTFTQDGKDIKLPYQLTALVKDGKIGMSRIYFDNLAVLTTLEYKITPPEKK